MFGSFGWSGEAVDEIEQRFKDAGFSFAFPTIRCKFKASADIILEKLMQICVMDDGYFLLRALSA